MKRLPVATTRKDSLFLLLQSSIRSTRGPHSTRRAEKKKNVFRTHEHAIHRETLTARSPSRRLGPHSLAGVRSSGSCQVL